MWLRVENLLMLTAALAYTGFTYWGFIQTAAGFFR